MATRTIEPTAEVWPELRFEDWQDGCETLHRWLQIVGKIKIAKSPWINHGWQSALYLTTRGVTTSLIHHGPKAFSIDFDFIVHDVTIAGSDGRLERFPLASMNVAEFHDLCFSALRNIGVEATIRELPNELPDATPLNKDRERNTYDPEFTRRFWRVLLQVERVMRIFRARFIGKASPIHLFWGSMDLAVTRFSGRRAPEHPGGVPHLPDLVTREAYSHEVSSCGFWPGNAYQYHHPAFYSYAYPIPEGFSAASVLPAGAEWNEKMKEFLLSYEAVRNSRNPDETLIAFFQSTYDAAANLGKWDRRALEHSDYLEQLQNRAAA